jgi:DNA topoisomerase-1|tara:strand:- start:332 stop:1282 length:951 start_codon:yes stop_codon:yes gene_type:complete
MKDYILRKKKGKAFVYYRHNKPVGPDSPLVQEYLEGLYVAPAYNDVKIFPPRKKVRAIGTDERGRKQYIYHKDYRKKSNKKKYVQLYTFGKKYKEIVSKINSDLSSFRDDKNKQIAMILKMIDECNFRVGNEKYLKENKSRGVCTLNTENVSVKKNTVKITFRGKKGITNACEITNDMLKKHIKHKVKTQRKKDRLFTYRVNNRYATIRASDVNNYLKQFGNISAKNFRTWRANIDLLKLLVLNVENKNGSYLKECIKSVAGNLHHTPEICKKNYLNEDILKLYTNDKIKFFSYFNTRTEEQLQRQLLEFLKKTYL